MIAKTRVEYQGNQPHNQKDQLCNQQCYIETLRNHINADQFYDQQFL